jgi:hypothetical protein
MHKKVGLAAILDLNNIPQFQHALVVHSWETRLDEVNSLMVRGNVFSKNGLGSGSVSAVLKHVPSADFWGEV